MERLDTLQMVGCGSVDHNGLLHIANGCASLKVSHFIHYHGYNVVRVRRFKPELHISMISSSQLGHFTKGRDVECGFAPQQVQLTINAILI